MKRRTLLASAAAAALARPAIAGNTQTLVQIPQVALNSIDPIWSSAQIVRNMGYMVFEMLYGRDENMVARPQMVGSDLVEDDAKRWTMKLRDGLVWHDGEKVLARDCVASLRRWLKRNPAGTTIEARTDSLEATDDRTIVWRFSKPYPHLRQALSQIIIPPMMMPERIAATDPFKQITEAVGCGPFRWLADEHVLASHAAFARFDKYVPRNEPPSYTAGGHKVLLDRVEWKMIPDAQTATNALLTGEVDWMEIALPDLLPLLRGSADITTGALDPFGQIVFMRPNHLQPPMNNIKVLKAMQAALDQHDVIASFMGSDPANMIAPVGFLTGDNKDVQAARRDIINRKYTTDQVKQMVAESGYKGERIVVLDPTDQIYYHPATLTVAQMLTDVGFNIDTQPMDWGTVQTRRTSKEPVDKGGWSFFVSVVTVTDYHSPLLAAFMRGNGTKGWFGWPTDAEMEKIYDAWLETTDPAKSSQLEVAYEKRAFDFLPFIPLGHYRQTSAWRKNVHGILKGPSAVFWNISKT
jgi:peptide/nickel transport system substrate-binding protein